MGVHSREDIALQLTKAWITGKWMSKHNITVTEISKAYSDFWYAVSETRNMLPPSGPSSPKQIGEEAGS
jgi:hypothetical protein